jgi:hypothetical protein
MTHGSALWVLFVVATCNLVVQFDTNYHVAAFTPSHICQLHQTTSLISLSVASTPLAESDVPTESAVDESNSDTPDVTIPTNLPSECGMDYVPLASMLATGQLAEADQVR